MALLLSNGTILAAPAKTPAASPSTGSTPMKISPLRTDVTIEAGASKKVTVYLYNLTSQPTTYKAILNDFVAGDEKGKPSLILDENSYAPSHSLKRFMQPLSTVTVDPGQTKQVDVTITVPKDAQAGGYFGAIRFAPVSVNGALSVGLNGSVASLILATVPGNLVESLQLTNFDIQQNGGTSSNFRTPDNLELYMRFKNTGNVQAAPFGAVSVSKGNKVLYKYDFNMEAPRDTVLPDTARRWEVPLKNFGNFGKYSIQGNFTYGTTGKTVEIKKTVWIVPTMYIFIGIGLLLVLILIIALTIALIRAKRSSRANSRRY